MRREPSERDGIERCGDSLGRRRQERRRRSFKQRQSEVRGAGLPVLAPGRRIAVAVVVYVVAVIVIGVVVVVCVGLVVVVERVEFGPVRVVVSVRRQVGHGRQLSGQQEHPDHDWASRWS